MRGVSRAALLVAALSSRAVALDWDSTAHEILIPTAPPELEESDPWFCAASNLTRFFDVPLPPDGLYDAIQTRGAEYFKKCASTVTGRDALVVCNPDKDHWCQITTKAPGALDTYLSYGSSASSWWKAHSSDALELAPQCPDNWYNAMLEFPAGESWLNLTIIFGACYEEVMGANTTPAGTIELSTATASATATAVPGDSGTNQGVTATPGPDSGNGVVRRETGIWAATAAAAAAVANAGF